MRHRIIMLVGLALLLTACGSGGSTAGPVEPVAVGELDAKVQASAQALLQRDAIPIAVIYFDFADREQIVRYDWIEYRPGGDLLAVTNFLDGEGAIGLARTGGEWRMAVESPQESKPWQTQPGLGETPEVVAAIEQLEAMTTQETPPSPGSDPALLHEATRQTASDGSELWSLLAPLGDGLVDTQQWIVNSAGLLQFYRVFSETPLLDGRVGTIVMEYGVEDEERDPIVIPDLGTKLRLDDLGIPEALQDLEE